MTFLIANTFTTALVRLSGPEQGAAKASAMDMLINPAHPSLQLHRVDRARDPNFWTARVNRDVRLVVHKLAGNTLLAWVGHHDDAYKWAETRRIDTHPKTGAAQIVEFRETVLFASPQRQVGEISTSPRLFENVTSETLLGWGVPQDWVDTVRDATEDTVLDIAEHLPEDAVDAILSAATGGRPSPPALRRLQASRREGQAAVLPMSRYTKTRKPEVPPTNTGILARLSRVFRIRALPLADKNTVQARTSVQVAADPFVHPRVRHQFKLIYTGIELVAAMDAPVEKWAIYLNPAPPALEETDVVLALGQLAASGSGWYISALHRAAFLAGAHPHKYVLLTAANPDYADKLKSGLETLRLNPTVRDRIWVRMPDQAE